MSISTDTDSWVGSTLTDSGGHRLGTIEEIYTDEQSGLALWMVVKTGRFGTRRSFVPLADALPGHDAIVTSYDRGQIADAPRIDPADDLPDDQVRELYRHYDLQYDAPVDSPCAPAETAAMRVMRYLA